MCELLNVRGEGEERVQAITTQWSSPLSVWGQRGNEMGEPGQVGKRMVIS